jgi:squalene-associated FAD-dependent desaturase
MTAAATNGARGGRRVVVVGGGLAGMAAAVALESAGLNVTLLEARRTLGGRAGSFEDPQTGEELDNCQHVLLGCCTNLLDFYRRIGAADRIRFEPAIHFIDETGRRQDLFGVRRLPAPLHLGPALLGFGLLSWAERIELSRATLAMIRLGRDGRQRLADVPFGTWLDEHGQSPELVRKLYDTVLIGALNEETRLASAAYAIQVFQDSLLANAAGYPVGIPACTLSELYRRLPCADVRLGTRVAGLAFSGDRVTGVRLLSGPVVDADAVVLATNYHAIDKWLPPEWLARDARFRSLDRLESVPILGAHLWFDRPVMAESHAALLGGALQWIFRKDATGTSLHGVISAARPWVDRPKDEMLRLFEAQVRAALPKAAGAKLLRGVVVIEKRATFSPTPGVDRHRPQQAPPPDGLAGLFLAGDYTQTGWPATMEGAVRSGYIAADAVVRQLTPDAPAAAGKSFFVDDLPVQWPSRLLGLSG